MKPSAVLRHRCLWLRNWRTPTLSSIIRWMSSRPENRWRCFGKRAYRTAELLKDIDVQRMPQEIRAQVHSEDRGAVPLVFQLWQELHAVLERLLSCHLGEDGQLYGDDAALF